MNDALRSLFSRQMYSSVDFDTLTSIAISGGADNGDEDHHRKVCTIVSSFIARLAQASSQIALITNGTRDGVPEATVTTAITNSLPIIRVYPEKGEKYLFPCTPILDYMVEPRVGESEWTDDAEVFVKIADAVLFVGGKCGTLTEIAHMAKINERRLRKGIPPIWVVPIVGIGGWSEFLFEQVHSHFPQIVGALPDHPIMNGIEAADWLLQKLNVE